ncbi:hypothetical protein PAPYR_180 [Paratrimastix pyriformis]|uniref:F-box domain-containing protein n=1 Tax=Paratrimastix pyriformis TaxID=342808 RepID=A0ABQ8UV29_9EUKA|nr:hypothetical protein PAPYR_180 [Paratrimastix pyriformis]
MRRVRRDGAPDFDANYEPPVMKVLRFPIFLGDTMRHFLFILMAILQPLLEEPEKSQTPVPKTHPNRKKIVRSRRRRALRRAIYRLFILQFWFAALVGVAFLSYRSLVYCKPRLTAWYIKKLEPFVPFPPVPEFLRVVLRSLVGWSIAVPEVIFMIGFYGGILSPGATFTFRGQALRLGLWKYSVLHALTDLLAVLFTGLVSLGGLQLPNLVRYFFAAEPEEEDDEDTDGYAAAPEPAPAPPPAQPAPAPAPGRPDGVDDETWEAIQLAAANGDADNYAHAPDSAAATMAPAPAGPAAAPAPATATAAAVTDRRPGKYWSERGYRPHGVPLAWRHLDEDTRPRWVKKLEGETPGYLSFVLRQLELTLVNLLVAAPAAVILAAPWRWSKGTVRGLKRGGSAHLDLPLWQRRVRRSQTHRKLGRTRNPFMRRGILFAQGVHALLDLPWLLICLLPILLTGWRAPRLWRDLRGRSVRHMRSTLFGHWCAWLTEVFCGLLCLGLTLVPWRAPLLWLDMAKRPIRLRQRLEVRREESRKRIEREHSKAVARMLDWLGTGYEWLSWREVADEEERHRRLMEPAWYEQGWRAVALGQAWYGLMDLPAVVGALVLLVTRLHAADFLEALRKRRANPDAEYAPRFSLLHDAVWEAGSRLALEVGAVVLALAVTLVSPLRAYYLILPSIRCRTVAHLVHDPRMLPELVWVLVGHALLAPLDLPVLLMAGPVLGSWRHWRFIRRARPLWPQFPIYSAASLAATAPAATSTATTAAAAATTTIVGGGSLSDSLAAAFSGLSLFSGWGWGWGAADPQPPLVLVPHEHATRLMGLVVAEFWAGLMGDLPHVVLLLATLWRLPKCLGELFPGLARRLPFRKAAPAAPAGEPETLGVTLALHATPEGIGSLSELTLGGGGGGAAMMVPVTNSYTPPAPEGAPKGRQPGSGGAPAEPLDGPTRFRVVVRAHFVQTLWDLPFLPAALLVGACAWRLKEFLAQWRLLEANQAMLQQEQLTLEKQVAQQRKEDADYRDTVRKWRKAGGRGRPPPRAGAAGAPGHPATAAAVASLADAEEDSVFRSKKASFALSSSAHAYATSRLRGEALREQQHDLIRKIHAEEHAASRNSAEVRARQAYRRWMDWLVGRVGSPATRLDWELRSLLVRQAATDMLDVLCVVFAVLLVVTVRHARRFLRSLVDSIRNPSGQSRVALILEHTALLMGDIVQILQLATVVAGILEVPYLLLRAAFIGLQQLRHLLAIRRGAHREPVDPESPWATELPDELLMKIFVHLAEMESRKTAGAFLDLTAPSDWRTCPMRAPYRNGTYAGARALTTAGMVCRRWRQMTCEQSLWARAVERRWDVNSPAATRLALAPPRPGGGPLARGTLRPPRIGGEERLGRTVDMAGIGPADQPRPEAEAFVNRLLAQSRWLYGGNCKQLYIHKAIVEAREHRPAATEEPFFRPLPNPATDWQCGLAALLQDEFWLALKGFPQLLLLPVKLCALPLAWVPLYCRGRVWLNKKWGLRFFTTSTENMMNTLWTRCTTTLCTFEKLHQCTLEMLAALVTIILFQEVPCLLGHLLLLGAALLTGGYPWWRHWLRFAQAQIESAAKAKAEAPALQLRKRKGALAPPTPAPETKTDRARVRLAEWWLSVAAWLVLAMCGAALMVVGTLAVPSFAGLLHYGALHYKAVFGKPPTVAANASALAEAALLPGARAGWVPAGLSEIPAAPRSVRLTMSQWLALLAANNNTVPAQLEADTRPAPAVAQGLLSRGGRGVLGWVLVSWFRIDRLFVAALWWAVRLVAQPSRWVPWVLAQTARHRHDLRLTRTPATRRHPSCGPPGQLLEGVAQAVGYGWFVAWLVVCVGIPTDCLKLAHMAPLRKPRTVLCFRTLRPAGGAPYTRPNSALMLFLGIWTGLLVFLPWCILPAVAWCLNLGGFHAAEHGLLAWAVVVAFNTFWLFLVLVTVFFEFLARAFREDFPYLYERLNGIPNRLGKLFDGLVYLLAGPDPWCYAGLLGLVTRACRRASWRGLANGVHTVFSMVWMFWPMVPSFLTGSVALGVATVPLCVFLVALGAVASATHWKAEGERIRDAADEED